MSLHGISDHGVLMQGIGIDGISTLRVGDELHDDGDAESQLRVRGCSGPVVDDWTFDSRAHRARLEVVDAGPGQIGLRVHAVFSDPYLIDEYSVDSSLVVEILESVE